MKTAIITLTKNGAFLGERVKAGIDADIYKRRLRLLGGIGRRYSCPIRHLYPGYGHRHRHAHLCPLYPQKDGGSGPPRPRRTGRFVISLLSGHLGGANRTAIAVAKQIGATPVITTASDVNGKIAWDVLAKRNDLLIENIDNLKHIGSAIVNGEQVELLSTLKIRDELPPYLVPYGGGQPKHLVILSSRNFDIECDHALILRPLHLVLGIGVRKGVPMRRFGGPSTICC